MSLVKAGAFEADVTALKSGTHFWRPSINIDGKHAYWHTSLKGLIDWLRANYFGAQPITMSEALARCGNPNDERLVKYMPAIERLSRSWGRHAVGYPVAAPSTEARNKAMWNFARRFVNWPLALQAAQPSWDELELDAQNPAAFGMRMGNAYLGHFQQQGRRVDITGRSLLLAAGFAPPVASGTDNGYAHKLGLTLQSLQGMANSTVLDIACGGAIFGAEMAAAFNCQADGIDLSHNQIPAVLAAGQRRYARSAMYLKMLKDLGSLGLCSTPHGSGALVDRLVGALDATLTYYQNNPPRAGDILAAPQAFQQAMGAIRPGGWDYTTSMFLLCYFNPADQTTAVLNMCSVTHRAVLLHSGNVGWRGQLSYDQQAVRQAYPDARIQVIDALTHHIHL